MISRCNKGKLIAGEKIEREGKKRENERVSARRENVVEEKSDFPYFVSNLLSPHSLFLIELKNNGGYLLDPILCLFQCWQGNTRDSTKKRVWMEKDRDKLLLVYKGIMYCKGR